MVSSRSGNIPYINQQRNNNPLRNSVFNNYAIAKLVQLILQYISLFKKDRKLSLALRIKVKPAILEVLSLEIQSRYTVNGFYNAHQKANNN